MSVASRGSRGSRGGTYRKVAHSSEVDETLFGERHSVMARKASRGDTMSRKKILALTGRQSLATGASAPVVVASSELHRMKAAAVIKTADDLKRDAQLARAAQDARAAKARARKEHILRLEEKRKKAVPLTTLQKEKKAEDETVLQRASMLRAEALDDVKALNSYGEYAKTVTIRNKQLAEKKEREAREKEAERIRDLEMEIQRLEMVKMYHDREKEQRDALVEARKHIEVQMAERDAMRKAEQDRLRAEAARAKEEAVRVKEQEAKEFQESVERKAKQRAEVLKANEAAISAKHAAKEREIEEDRKIADYLKAEDARKAAEEREAMELRAKKELEFAKLRAQQEKLQDMRGAEDAKRARRAFEAGQREIRKKELEVARKAKALQDELVAARIAQQEEMELRKAMEIKREREEFQRNQKVRNEWLVKEAAVVDEERARNLKHKDGLIGSIDERAAVRRAQREAELAEGAKQRAALEDGLEEVRRIREQKMKELTDAGVDPLYTVELAKFDPAKAISMDYRRGKEKKMG